jgi:hypothetical protein
VRSHIPDMIGDRSLMVHRYFLFLLVNVVFIFLLASTYWQLVRDLANSPAKIPEKLAQALQMGRARSDLKKGGMLLALMTCEQALFPLIRGSARCVIISSAISLRPTYKSFRLWHHATTTSQPGHHNTPPFLSLIDNSNTKR